MMVCLSCAWNEMNGLMANGGIGFGAMVAMVDTMSCRCGMMKFNGST